MDFSRASLVAYLCLATVILSVAGVSPQKEVHNEKKEFSLDYMKTLPIKDKLMLKLLSGMFPQSFKELPKDIFNADILEYPYMPSIDNFFIDAKQLFVQSKKIESSANLPEFNWGYRYDFCFWFFCIDFEARYTTRDSKFVGSENVESVTEVTPTSFTNNFHIPFFNWTSPGFLVNFTDYRAERINLNRNFFISFEDLTIGLQADYHFVPDVGIQLENFTVFFDAGRVRGWIMDLTAWDFEGNLLARYDPSEYPYDEVMMDYWGWVKRQYTSGIQFSLNCFLSNGRSDPEGCIDDSGYLEADYYRLLNLQFLQTLGLGALLNQ